jgi:NAD(P)-dependent dehydrogenase (short-subunit alcohol dehydrogenase family)
MPTNHRWTTNNIPDQSGKTVIITGANSGLGFESTRALADKGARVVMACRDTDKGWAAMAPILDANPAAALEVMLLDLADLSSVRAFAEAFSNKHDRLDILMNNAGVMALPKRRETADGFEMQFGVNHLGHFALTGLLLDHLLSTPSSRVVTVSSNAHKFGRIQFDNLNAEKSYSQWGAYCQSKLANLLFAYELQRRLEKLDADTISVAAHPGYAATNLQRTSAVSLFMNRFVAQDQAMGALPQLCAATATDVKSGDYYGPDRFFEQRGHPIKVQSNRAAHDEAVARRLWSVSEELTGVQYQGLG